MTQKIIAFVGISGVGKTTFLQSLASEIAFQHLTAGSLISLGTSAAYEDRDKLRLLNVDENQRHLIAGFHSARDPQTALVIMDGHAVIDTGNGLEIIDAGVFAALGINALMHLVAEPAQIISNRKNDSRRTRPELPEHLLEEHQQISIHAAQMVARSLGVPFLQVMADDVAPAKAFVQRL